MSLVLTGVGHRYGSVLALDDVTLELGEGVTALVGVNGAGKSTLMSIGSGALSPSSGTVSVGGASPFGKDRPVALRRLALMPQSATFPRSMTALEVVSYLTWMRGSTSSDARRRAARALDQVGLGPRSHDRVGALSGGMLRRVALAQALAAEAVCLLLDEPSTGLDPEQRRIMVDLIGGLPGTTLMSSHVMEDVVETAARVVVLDAGRIVFDGTVAQLQSTAPVGGEPARAAEMAFLQLISQRARG